MVDKPQGHLERLKPIADIGIVRCHRIRTLPKCWNHYRLVPCLKPGKESEVYSPWRFNGLTFAPRMAMAVRCWVVELDPFCQSFIRGTLRDKKDEESWTHWRINLKSPSICLSFEIYKLQFRFGLFPTHFGVLVKKFQAGKGLVDETNWNQYLGASTFNDKADCDMSTKKENHKKWSLLTVLHQFAHNKSGKFSLCYWLTSAKKHQPFGTCWPVKLHPGEIEAMGQKLDDLDSSRLYVGEFGFRGFHQWDSGQSQCEHGLVPWIPILEGKTGWMWTSIRSIMRTSNFFGKPHIFWLHSFGKAPRLSEILIDSCHLYRRLFTQRGLFLLLINTAFHRGISQISWQTK